MDNDLLNSCSGTVQQAVTHIHSELSNKEGFRVRNAPAYELLDCVNSDLSKQFVRGWKTDNFTPGELHLEWLKSIISLIKLEKKYCSLQDDNGHLSQIISEMKTQQTIHGRILTNDVRHTGPLFCLVLFEPDSLSTENALQYFLSNYDEMTFKPEYPDSQLATGGLALCYKDFDYYEEELQKISRLLEKCWAEETFLKLEEKERLRVDELGMNLMALSKLPGEHEETIDKISKLLKDRQHETGYWTYESDVLDTALATAGLVSIGEGPKIPSHSVNWEKELAKQRREKSKPRFVTTFPARASASHTAEIYEKAKSLIVSAEDHLRISTQYIDMLYEDIIDSIHKNSDLTVKILTRGKDVAGNRKRIKKGVIDELIEVTEGNVRGNRRLHARMVIADQHDMVVSSADLTRDQLHDEFNGGVYTKDHKAVSEAIAFFDEVWEESDPVNHG